MECKLSPEKTILLDNLIRSTRAETFTIEVDNIFQIHMTTPDLSQMTIIRLDESFFEIFTNTMLVKGSFNVRRIYEPSMKLVTIKVEEKGMRLEYIFNHMKYTKIFESLEPNIFDIEFQAVKECEIELSGLKKVLRDIKDKEIKIKMGKELKISGQSVEISVGRESIEAEFTADTEKFRSIVGIAENFYTVKLNFPSDNTVINVIMESSDVFLSSFISIE